MCKVGLRVNVFDGSGQNYLGQGEIVDFVSVYIFNNPDGSISSNQYAETKPEGVPDELLRVSPSNPKIKLDSGRIVYGCQTWWKPVKESENEPIQPNQMSQLQGNHYLSL